MSPRKGESRTEYLARRKVYRETPESKARQRIYHETPACKSLKNAQRLKAQYGITPAQKEAMSESQNHQCLICNLPREQSKDGTLQIDHCHKTNIIRELLCHRCNVGLGCFKDDPDLLEKAATYIRKHDALHSIQDLAG